MSDVSIVDNQINSNQVSSSSTDFNQSGNSQNGANNQPERQTIPASGLTPAEAHYYSGESNISLEPTQNQIATKPSVSIYEKLQRDATEAERRALRNSDMDIIYGVDRPPQASTNIFLGYILAFISTVAIVALVSPLIQLLADFTLFLYFPTFLLLIVGFIFTSIYKVNANFLNFGLGVFVIELGIMFFVILHSAGILTTELPFIGEYLSKFYF